LVALGAEPVELPTTQILPASDSRPLDDAIDRLACSAYDWIIFANTDSVSFFMSRLFALGHDVRALAGPKLAAVDHTTAETLLEYGLVTDFVPTGYVGGEIVAEISDVTGQRMLLPCSDMVPPHTSASFNPVKETLTTSLVNRLRAQGALVEEVLAYTIGRVDPDPVALSLLLDGGVDVVTFTSPPGVMLLTEMLNNRPAADVLSPLTVACIGPSTADAARALGVRVDVVAEEHTVEGLVEALVKWRGEGKL
jgi:uroporphyrinogen-III synthase